MRFTTLLLVSILLVWCSAESLADPPSWAPAHGYRDKHKGKQQRGDGGRAHYYVGYSGREYDRDFEIVQGRCNREQIGAVLGGIAGGVVGNQIASRDARTVSTIVGLAVGALIGAKIGRDMDDRDRACMGQALELGATGQRIAWENESNSVRYELVPANGARETRGVCRDFTLTTVSGRERQKREGRACQTQPGVWEMRAS